MGINEREKLWVDVFVLNGVTLIFGGVISIILVKPQQEPLIQPKLRNFFEKWCFIPINPMDEKLRLLFFWIVTDPGSFKMLFSP